MTFEVLISTMYQLDYSLLDKMNVTTDAVVINQCNSNSVERFEHNSCSVLWINTTERGLSKSRNMALKNASADICLISDDDLEYRNDYKKNIIDSFKKNTKASIISFEVNGIEKEFKKYPNTSHQVGYIKSLKIASVEIAFKRRDIISNDLAFDELLGAGTKFLLGEENAFLFQCLKKKLKIFFEPIIISDLHIGNSTWFSKRDDGYFIAKGASFEAMKTPFTHLLILQWAIRKYKLYSKDMPVLKALTLMNKGRKEYLKEVKRYDT